MPTDPPVAHGSEISLSQMGAELLRVFPADGCDDAFTGGRVDQDIGDGEPGIVFPGRLVGCSESAEAATPETRAS